MVDQPKMQNIRYHARLQKANPIDKRDPLWGGLADGVSKINSAWNAAITPIFHPGGSNSGSNSGGSGGGGGGGSGSSGNGSSGGKGNGGGNNSPGSGSGGSNSNSFGGGGSNHGSGSSGNASNGGSNSNHAGSSSNTESAGTSSGSSGTSNNAVTGGNGSTGDGDERKGSNNDGAANSASSATLINDSQVTPAATATGSGSAAMITPTSPLQSASASGANPTASDSGVQSLGGDANGGSFGTGARGKSSNAGAIAGSVVAVLLSMAVGVLLYFYLRRRRRRREQERVYDPYYPSNTAASDRGRLPGLLGSSSNEQPEMATSYSDSQSPFRTPVSMFDRMNRLGTGMGLRRNDNGPGSEGPQTVIRSNSPDDRQSHQGDDSSLSSPATACSSSISPRPHVSSIDEALRSGELAYDDDASSFGGESQLVLEPERMTHSAPFECIPQLGQQSQGTFIMVGPPDAQQPVGPLINENPFSPSPSSEDRNSGIAANGSPLSQQGSFQSLAGASEVTSEVMSRDTFGLPQSPLSSPGLAYDPERRLSQGFATAATRALNVAAMQAGGTGTIHLSRGSPFTPIIEEDASTVVSIPDDIKLDTERNHNGSLLTSHLYQHSAAR